MMDRFAAGGISTHALREEGDLARAPALDGWTRFLPTPSARRATGDAIEQINQASLFLPTPSARRATRKW